MPSSPGLPSWLGDGMTTGVMLPSRTRSLPGPRLADFAGEGYVAPVKTYRFNDVRVLALDQALKNTGVVDVVFHGPNIEVLSHRTMTFDYDLAGNAAVLDAGTQYFPAIRDEIISHFSPGPPAHDVIVFETPPVAFRLALHRTESSMMAALCIRLFCAMSNVSYQMVQHQKATTIWAANPKASKTQLKRSILERFPYLKGQMTKASEHEWDALALAMTHALGEVSDGQPI